MSCEKESTTERIRRLKGQLAGAEQHVITNTNWLDEARANVERLKAELKAAEEAAKSPGQKVADWLNQGGPFALMATTTATLAAKLDEIIAAALAERGRPPAPDAGPEQAVIADRVALFRFTQQRKLDWVNDYARGWNDALREVRQHIATGQEGAA